MRKAAIGSPRIMLPVHELHELGYFLLSLLIGHILNVLLRMHILHEEVVGYSEDLGKEVLSVGSCGILI